MRNILLMFVCISLCNCASVHTIYDENLAREIHFGMTKKQIFDINSSPSNWTRQEINGHIYETWRYNSMENTFDFVNGVLVGYSTGHSGTYHSKSKTEDVRKYNKSSDPQPK